MKSYSFRKQNRLSLRNEIDVLFREGKVLYAGPLRVIYLCTGTPDETRILVTVPRRKFRKATDRNRIKRLLREAYRLNQRMLDSTSSASGLHVGFVYTGDKEDVGFMEIEIHVKEALSQLAKIISVPRIID